jgi:ABC-2 type transport system ATP-binding protein
MIELIGVCKSFDGNRAVDDFDHQFRGGCLTGFLGPNGAGKSTTIRMIMNILIPDSGSISVDGRPLSEEFRDQLGYLPEERGLYKKMKVIDHLMFFGTLKGLSRAEARRRAMGWLERLELDGRAQGKVEDLSKGMQQKIQFAGTLLHEPELILLDEPFSGLDPINTEVLKEVMLELKAAGRTVIFSTHMMEQAERLCDEIVLIDKGRRVLSGRVDELRGSFGRGHLLVHYSGNGSLIHDDARVAESSEDHPGRIELSLRDEADVSSVLRDWSSALEITHFEVIVPSMHNIFLKTVGVDRTAKEVTA